MNDILRINFLGVEITPMTREDLFFLIGKVIEEGDKQIIGNHNLHSIFLNAHDETMRQFCEKSSWTYIDGMPLILLGRLLGHELRQDQRVTFIDWRPLFTEAHRRGWRVFYLGSRPGVAQKGTDLLMREFPGLLMDSWHGYFDETTADNEAVVTRINTFRPQLLLVGMGMPRQEGWILKNLERLETNVICNSGATMDYIAEEVPTPPRWMGRIGLDWLYRLASEPRRLGKRYLVEPWFILWLLAKDIRSSSSSKDKQQHDDRRPH